nr:MAG TPA: hypothetical protein [Caudoviricetes sp.]
MTEDSFNSPSIKILFKCLLITGHQLQIVQI